MINELTCTTFLVVILVSLGKYRDSIKRCKTYIIIIQLIIFVYSLYTFFFVNILLFINKKEIVNRALAQNWLLRLGGFLGKVLTLNQLKRRGRALANRRFLCKEDEGDINHFLVHCKKARMLWDLFLSIVGTCWVFPDSVIQMLLSWQGAPVGKKRKNIWLAALLCLFWIVWQNSNMVVFDNRATSDQRTKIIFLSKLWSLANIHSVDNTNSLVDFLA